MPLSPCAVTSLSPAQLSLGPRRHVTDSPPSLPPPSLRRTPAPWLGWLSTAAVSTSHCSCCGRLPAAIVLPLPSSVPPPLAVLAAAVASLSARRRRRSCRRPLSPPLSPLSPPTPSPRVLACPAAVSPLSPCAVSSLYPVPSPRHRPRRPPPRRHLAYSLPSSPPPLLSLFPAAVSFATTCPRRLPAAVLATFSCRDPFHLAALPSSSPSAAAPRRPHRSHRPRGRHLAATHVLAPSLSYTCLYTTLAGVFTVYWLELATKNSQIQIAAVAPALSTLSLPPASSPLPPSSSPPPLLSACTLSLPPLLPSDCCPCTDNALAVPLVLATFASADAPRPSLPPPSSAAAVVAASTLPLSLPSSHLLSPRVDQPCNHAF
ncbi:hypothetical protein B0H15DRAFT_953626 [Mycena belliarum]|uniref:Uncharacterized protein n=1 Tax=Mycena belliarum TaxID=1033014 RepID=A0AAD6TWR1_9AGAR|nr:hypothetical protein B0H15DRAFT_953626 [Mycena belliae]